MKTHTHEREGFVKAQKQFARAPTSAARSRRNVGTAETIRFATGKCSLGLVFAAASAKGICFLSLGDDPATLLRELGRDFPRAELVAADQELRPMMAAVIRFVDNPQIGWSLPLDARGSAFQHRVWQALREIPAGSTMTYTGIAQRIGAPAAVRAVGSACAANKISVIIPCHRAVRTDGSLAGFRWGLERKRALLDKEAAA